MFRALKLVFISFYRTVKIGFDSENMRSAQKVHGLHVQPLFKIIWQPHDDFTWFSRLFGSCCCFPVALYRQVLYLKYTGQQFYKNVITETMHLWETVTEQGKLLRKLQSSIWQWGIKPINSIEWYTCFASKDSFLLRYDATSMGNRFPTFEGNVVSSSSKFKMSNILQVVDYHGKMTTVSATHTHHELMKKLTQSMPWSIHIND